MGPKTTLVIWLITLAFFGQTKSVKVVSRSTSAAAEGIIRKEIDRLAPILDAVEKANLNITVVFSHSKFDESGDNLLQYDAVELRPLSSKYDPNGPQVPEEVDEDQLKNIAQFANNLNLSSVASREVHSEDGSLFRKNVYVQNLKISYEDGVSHIIVKDIAGKVREKEFEEFVNMMKEYELPVEVHKTIYNQEGEVLKTDIADYKPTKVKIEGSDNMQIARQLKVAEALKRACVMKEEGNERMSLLCKYLGIQYPKSTWQAVMGGGDHSVYSNEWVKLSFEGQTYFIWGNKK